MLRCSAVRLDRTARTPVFCRFVISTGGRALTQSTHRDLKCMAKIATGILVLRAGKAAEWTPDIDSQFVAWLNKYVTWLTTAKIAIEEKESTK